ncbi:MAG: hypothetical protein C4288_20420 [Leptolyngbya sp. ERB_1_1]
MNSSRSTGLEIAIYYKFSVAGLLSAISLSLFSTAYNSSKLDAIADSGLFEIHLWFLDRSLDQVLNWNQSTMQFWGTITALYAILIFVQAVGLWFNRTWTKGLVLLTAGIGLPIELYELAHGFTLLKCLIFAINSIIFGYFWQHLKPYHYWQHQRTSKH